MKKQKEPPNPGMFQGSYQSPWRFLVMSSRSNLIHSIDWTLKLFEQYRNKIKNEIKPGEIYTTITTAYQRSLAGPLLGTIVLAAAAIENLFRLSIRSFFEGKMSKDTRGRGTQNWLSKEMDQFDGLSVFKKRDYLYRSLLNRKCTKELEEEFAFLFRFRNECFHSDPILRRFDGLDETTKKGKVGVVSYERGVYPEYPLIWASNRPLSLTHSLRAIRVHDRIVKDLLIEPDLSYLLESLETNENEWKDLDLIESVNRLSCAFSKEGITPDELDNISLRWDILVELRLGLVTDEEKRHYQAELLRKIVIKRVK